jgi:hypothetical protein
MPQGNFMCLIYASSLMGNQVCRELVESRAIWGTVEGLERWPGLT